MKTHVTVHQLADGNAFLNVWDVRQLGTVGVGVWSAVTEDDPTRRRAILALGPEKGCRDFALLVFDCAAALTDWLDTRALDIWPVVYEITPAGLREVAVGSLSSFRALAEQEAHLASTLSPVPQ